MEFSKEIHLLAKLDKKNDSDIIQDLLIPRRKMLEERIAAFIPNFSNDNYVPLRDFLSAVFNKPVSEILNLNDDFIKEKIFIIGFYFKIPLTIRHYSVIK